MKTTRFSVGWTDLSGVLDLRRMLCMPNATDEELEERRGEMLRSERLPGEDATEESA